MKDVHPCEGSGYYAKDIIDGFADCPYCHETRAVRSDGSIRSHREKPHTKFLNKLSGVEAAEPVDLIEFVVTPEEPPKEEPAVIKGVDLSKPSYILTHVDGVVVGWDTCGRCLTHIRRCDCKDGPVWPKYVKELEQRNESKLY